MYLVDTELISEIRKGEKAYDGVREFFEVASRVERLRHRGDIKQADLLERWLKQVQIAATALIHDLTVVTRNTEHFAPTGGMRLKNPFDGRM
jgi:toxin FitB